MQQKLKNDPAFQARHEEMEQQCYQWLKGIESLPQQSKGASPAYVIPVVVHIIHQFGPENITDIQVEQGIQHLNAAFANSGYYDNGDGVATPFQFCLARRKPDGSPTNGINRVQSTLTFMDLSQDSDLKNLSRWDPTQYVNIWVIKKISGNIAGYAFFPGSHGGPEDGIVMEAEWMGSSFGNSTVLAHEMGHYLGLYHTFQNGCYNNNCLLDGDKVCDTPPDQSTSWTPCGTVQNSCVTDTDSGFATDQNDMTINYMDYATWDCYNAFTQGQSDRMEFFLLGARQSLLLSQGCNDPCIAPVTASFSASASGTLPAGTVVNFTNTSVNGANYEWTVNGNVVGTSANLNYVLANAGTQVVLLKVWGSDPSCTDFAADTFFVVCPVVVSFSADKPNPAPGETITCTYTGSGATLYEWLLNGMPVGSAASVAIPIPGPGSYSICLNASNGFCQQQTCRLIEVADTNQCFESWWKKLDLNASSGSFGGGFVQLPGGDMLAGAVLDYANQHFVRFSPMGVVTQHWNIVQQNVVSGISDFSVSSDGHVLVLRSNLSGNSINNCFMEKINYATGQVAWSKRLMLPQPMFVWKIEEHPATQHYWIWGRVTGTAQQLPTDQAIVLEINPADGNILSQKNYSIGTAPLVKATVPAGNFIYGAGYHYTGAIGFKPMLAKFDMTGALVWSKQFDFAPLAFVEWTDVARDGDDILLTGADGNTIFFTKTDLDGNPLEVKSFNIGGMLSYYSHADKVNINVLSDGYLLTFGYFTSAQDDGRMVFLKIDKSGNIDWAKNTVLLPEWDGVEVLINGGQIVAMACQGFHGDDLYLFKTPVAPATPEDCAHDQPDITASVPAWTLSTFMPAPLNAAPVGSATLNTTTQNISVPLETLCAANACPEICGNGLDDDSDGYVDCFDASDCPCDDLPECIRIDTIVPPDTRIAGKLDWASPGNTAFIGFTPVAANLNPKQDNMPEIVAGKWVARQTTDELLIFRGDGSDAATPRKLIIPERLSAFHPTTPAIGDLDGDGIPELAVICADHHMRVYNNYQPDANPVMTLMAVSTDTTLLNRSSKPLLADFDANGISEIYLGNEVFWFDFSTPGNPALRRTAPTSTVPSGRETHDDRTSCSIAADLLSPIDCAGDPDCEGLEIAAGYAIYSVDLDPSDGDPVEIKKQRDLSNMPPIATYTDGHTTVGDVDLDGILDILVTGRRSGNMGVYIWNKNGLVKFIPLPTFGSPYAGLVAVGNVYDDKLSGVATDLPEMVVCAWGNRVYALNINAANQTPATPWWWTLQPPAGSGFTSAALFDFNNDGFAEVVVRDLDSLSILYGGPAPFPPGVNSKRSWFSFSIASSYLDQYPTVADADNDGQAEVVLIGRPQAPSTVNLVNESIVVLEADVALGVPWAPARPLWNQFNYYPVSINDDLSIPKTQQPSHFELPGPGSGKRPYNLFLGQPSKYDNNFNPFVFLPDAGVSLDAMRCNGDTLIFTARICNKGSTDIPAETPLRLYAADPTTSTTAALPHIPALPLDIKPDSCLSFEIALPAPPGAQHIYLVVNDNGNQATPFDLSADFPVSSIAECDYSNNMAAIDLPLPPPLPPDLGPDVTVCQNGVWTFDAGPGFESYKWSDLTTEPIITVYEPGIYWVEARDVCGNVYSDTVSVTVDAATVIELGADTILCGGGTLQFNVPGFVEYQWFPVNGLSCSTCGNPGAQPSADVTYTVVAKTALGCYSTDSIKVTIGQVVQIQLDTAACAGETLSIHGTAIPAGSLQVIYLPSATGCDSVLNVAVAMLPVVQTAENQTICTGDSALIFGQWQSQAGAFSQTFTAMGGCDSTHTVALDVLPALQTTESRSICAGDSALIFGQWQNQAGAFSQTFTATGGCDSTH
ncbi:MAG: hypothetical protein DYG98_27325, partial [Haliscomenobacteraceae bacterium CHB4]|nr:hypothetical protein [Haliscomenobacteraceae bacterium CHB4]